MIYDFNISVGDTLKWDYLNKEFPRITDKYFIVETEDTIYLGDGQPRKRYKIKLTGTANFANGSYSIFRGYTCEAKPGDRSDFYPEHHHYIHIQPLYLVEGIGWNQGLLYDINYYYSYMVLLSLNRYYCYFDWRDDYQDESSIVCFEEDGVNCFSTRSCNIYDTSYNKCLFVGLDDINQLSDRIILYPNPTQNELNIESPYEIERITISDIIGVTKKSLNVKGNKIVVPISDLEKGTYLVSIRSSEGNHTKKIVKE